jgi:hypothetical protein
MAGGKAKRENITTDVIHAGFYDSNHGSGAYDRIKRIAARAKHA